MVPQIDKRVHYCVQARKWLGYSTRESTIVQRQESGSANRQESPLFKRKWLGYSTIASTFYFVPMKHSTWPSVSHDRQSRGWHTVVSVSTRYTWAQPSISSCRYWNTTVWGSSDRLVSTCAVVLYTSIIMKKFLFLLRYDKPYSSLWRSVGFILISSLYYCIRDQPIFAYSWVVF